jgi:hypothetical protein
VAGHNLPQDPGGVAQIANGKKVFVKDWESLPGRIAICPDEEGDMNI